MRMTVGMLKVLLAEASVPLRKPQTPEQKQAMIDLIKWASQKMGAEQDAQVAFAKAKKGDWEEAMDLLRTYYVMKGIPFKDTSN